MTDYGNNLSAADPPHLFGGWSQYMYIIPGSFLVRVPDDLPSEVAVLTEIMAVTVGLDRAKQMSVFPSEAFLFDDTVVVLGVGPLGMCFLMKARMLGAGNIIAVDLSDYRLQFAKRLGADHVLKHRNTTLAERLGICPQSHPRTRSRHGDRDGRRAPGCSGRIGNDAAWADYGGGRQFFRPRRSTRSARIVTLRKERQNSGRRRRRARQPTAQHAADGPIHAACIHVREFVSHRFPLREVEAGVHKSVAPDSMKVAIDALGVISKFESRRVHFRTPC